MCKLLKLIQGGKLKKLLVLLAASLLTLSAKAQEERLQSLDKMKKNVYYLLTENRAKALNIDLVKLKLENSVTSKELVTVFLDENAQLNLSIFDEAAFNQLAMDIIK